MTKITNTIEVKKTEKSEMWDLSKMLEIYPKPDKGPSKKNLNPNSSN